MTPFNKMQQKEFEELVATKGKAAVLWLIEQYETEVPTKIYPRIKGEDGKTKVDKTAEPKIEMRPKSFIAIKSEFAEKFAPELAPKAKAKVEAKRSDRVEALKKLLATM